MLSTRHDFRGLCPISGIDVRHFRTVPDKGRSYPIAGIKPPKAARLTKDIKQLFKREPDREWRDHIEAVATILKNRKGGTLYLQPWLLMCFVDWLDCESLHYSKAIEYPPPVGHVLYSAQTAAAISPARDHRKHSHDRGVKIAFFSE